MVRKPRAIPTGPAWINQIFTSQQARNDGVVRRSRADTLQYASFAALRLEVRRRGFHMIRTGEQYVIFCHTGELRLVC